MSGKDILKITLNLVVIYVIGGLLLAGVFAKTSPIIFKKQQEEKAAALKAMEPTATEDPKEEGKWEPWGKHGAFYSLKGPEGPLGYIVETFGKGYSSYISILVATDNDLNVKKINILSHGETPGLGDEILADWFTKQFVGKGLDHLVVIKGETKDDIQAITGATISTRAVTNGVKDAVQMLKATKEQGFTPHYTWGHAGGHK